MAEGYFWGTTISGEKGTATWDPEENLKSASDFSRGHSLTLKQAMLSPDAKKGEVNIVQVDTVGYQTDIKMPVFRLEAENCVQVSLDLTFPDAPVTFTLIKGSGPVHILGFHNVVSVIEEESEEDMDEEAEDIEDEEEGIVNGEKDAKKRKLGSAEKQKPKKAKMDEEDIEDEDVDLDDEDEEKGQKRTKSAPASASKKKPAGKPAAASKKS